MTQPEEEYPSSLGEVSFELAQARDSLHLERRGSKQELRRAIGYSVFAGALCGIEVWGILRGEPVMGWLVFVIFVGFASYFWSRRRKAEKAILGLEEVVRSLEGRRATLADGGESVRPLP